MKEINLTCDSITIDTDEKGWELVIDTHELGPLRVNIHGVALDLEEQVRKTLRPYALEAYEARYTMPASDDEQADGYDLDDPKHPTYYERMVG